MSSFAQCSWTIGGCLRASEQFLGPNRVWFAANEVQSDYLGHHFHRTRNIDLDVLEFTASTQADELMSWLAQRSFNININPFAPGEFGAASVLDVLLKWLEGMAKCAEVRGRDGRLYAGVKLGVPIEYFESINAQDSQGAVVAKILTQDPRTCVYMTMLDRAPEGEFGLLKKARELKANMRRAQDGFAKLIFPMIHLEEQRTLSWLIGMSTLNERTGLPMHIGDAIQVNRLRMNEEGVRAQSAAVIVVRLFSAERNHVIDAPFLFWIERDGVEEPFFSAWLDFDAWKNPGSLA